MAYMTKAQRAADYLNNLYECDDFTTGGTHDTELYIITEHVELQLHHDEVNFFCRLAKEHKTKNNG